MILVDLVNAIAATLTTEIPALVEAKSHGGRFDLAEIKKAATRTPSARVSCLGLRSIDFEGAVVTAEAQCVIFIVAADQVAMRRDAVSMTLVAAISALLPDNCWGLSVDTVEGARQCRADNLFSRQLDDAGVALWGLSFTHQVELSRVSITDLADFLRAYVSYDLAPTDGTIDASDQIDLPQE